MLQIQRKGGGARTFVPDFADPLSLLVHCHGRIEAQLAALERAARAMREGEGPDGEAARAVWAARAHFAGPGVKHTEDEEVSLFPRLRAHKAALTAEVRGALDLLESQHRAADRVHAELEDAADDLDSSRSAGTGAIIRLEAAITELAGLYRPHILLENEVVYPAAGRILTADDLLAVGEEMRQRRKDMVAGVAGS